MWATQNGGGYILNQGKGKREVFDSISKATPAIRPFFLIYITCMVIGCGFPPPEGFVRFDEDPANQAMIQYAEQKVIDFTGVKPEWYEIWMADSLDRTLRACGGAACNKCGEIVIHPDTDEYVCQQLVHEMWHSAQYVLGKGWYAEPTPEYTAFISATCRKYGNW